MPARAVMVDVFISFYGGGGWLALSCRKWCILLHDSLIPSLCPAHAVFLSLCGRPFVVRAVSQQRCHRWVEGVCAGSVGQRCPSWCCLLLPQIQQSEELDVLDPGREWTWLTFKFKIGPQLVCLSCKWQEDRASLFNSLDKTGFNSLDKTHWQLHIWSFKVLWLHIAVLQCSQDFTSVLYCCSWSQALLYPDPTQTEVLQSCFVCETQSNGWVLPSLFPSEPWFLSNACFRNEVPTPFQRQRVLS